MVDVTLKYAGSVADNNEIDLYDVARGLVGFQRSLALTTHLLVNGEIITQAPSLKGAQIITTTPEPGSWKVTATVVVGIWAMGTATKDSPFGHLLFSAYDYVVSETMGFHVGFDKALGQQYEEELAKKKITKEKMDSLIEKTEGAVSDIHRPIVGSKTASRADLYGLVGTGRARKIGPEFSTFTYDYIAHTIKSKDASKLAGVISSYNSNTYKGRIYCFEEGRPIPFELSDEARRRKDVNIITSSLRANAMNRADATANVRLTCYRLESSTGRLKALHVTAVEKL
jgi:hypothetical protein